MGLGVLSTFCVGELITNLGNKGREKLKVLKAQMGYLFKIVKIVIQIPIQTSARTVISNFCKNWKLESSIKAS